MDTLQLSGGCVQEGGEGGSSSGSGGGRPHSFMLRCRGDSPASSDREVLLAALDAPLKARLLGALCSVMGCSVAPPAPPRPPPPSAQTVSPKLSTAARKAVSLNEGNGSSKAGRAQSPRGGMQAGQQLTKQQVVERDRAARLKLQTEKITQLRSEGERRRREGNQPTLCDLLGGSATALHVLGCHMLPHTCCHMPVCAADRVLALCLLTTLFL